MKWPWGGQRLLILGLALGLLSALAWLALQGRQDGSLERLQERGVLRVGYAVEAPYALVGPGAEVTGESPETARRVAARLGLTRIEWVQVPFGELIPSLNERRFDMIAAGLFVTAERATKLRYADPSVRVLPGWLVRKGNPKGLTSYQAAAARRDVMVAVLEGSVEQQRLGALGLPKAMMLVVPDAQAGRSALAKGAADGLALSLPTTRWIANSSPETFEALPDLAPEGQAAPADWVAFAFHRDDLSLQQAWNQAQHGWIGGAEHARLVRRFGFARDDLGGETRVDDLLKR
nr:transporter substrate-binding domain-containing protein [uncultured Roseateles sp.]